MNIIDSALRNGLVSKVEIARQDGLTLFFKAYGTAPGQSKIIFESAEPDVAVAHVLTRLAELSPKNSPRGDEAAEILGKAGYVVPERGEDPKKEDVSKKGEVADP